jgi:gliding motility-associated-like protein
MIGIPKFFTPNEDGINDYWNIKGLKPESNIKSRIDIFNRFGKLIKQIEATGLGWDGMINGKKALSDDYWFVVNLENGTTAKGHFALKR